MRTEHDISGAATRVSATADAEARELTPLALCYTENGQLFIQLLTASIYGVRLARLRG